jgi:hypothetical protein
LGCKCICSDLAYGLQAFPTCPDSPGKVMNKGENEEEMILNVMSNIYDRLVSLTNN